MASRVEMINGYQHTPSMVLADRVCVVEHGCTLREWLFRWRAENPQAHVRELTTRWDVDAKTIYDWLSRLHIGTGGVMFIDLDAERDEATSGVVGH